MRAEILSIMAATHISDMPLTVKPSVEWLSLDLNLLH